MPNGYNQYIGMRYVPIIDGEWSQSKAYEPLVVVVYNGNSYISKTYVPAGTLPTNETYWILAANYNAQVEQYRQEVREYQETVQGFSDSIQANTNAIQANTNAISNINDVKIPADRARLTKLEQEHSRIVDSYFIDNYSATLAAATLTQVHSLTLSMGIWIVTSYVQPGTLGDHVYYHRIGSESIVANEMGGSNFTRVIENQASSYDYPIYLRMTTGMTVNCHVEAVKIANLTL